MRGGPSRGAAGLAGGGKERSAAIVSSRFSVMLLVEEL
jgi:hypothetical protein